jgi:hypothetical protein
MPTSWRRTLWFVGAVASLAVLIPYTLLSHAGEKTFYSLAIDFADRVLRPTFLTFFTVCVVGFLYELIMRPDDSASFDNAISSSVRAAIYGTEAGADQNRRGGSLSDQQASAKEELIDLTKKNHRARLRRFEQDKVLQIHDFGESWKILIGSTFEANEHLCDFTIGSNAKAEVQAYQFSNYYSNLFNWRMERRSSNSKVRILILCDWVGETPESEEAKAVSKELEGAVKRILTRIRTINRMPRNTTPSEVYRHAANDSVGIFQFRLVSPHQIKEADAPIFETPFNVYGNIGVSQSIGVGPAPGPIPHLVISLTASESEKCRRHFELVWDRALYHVEAFGETMDSWEAFGTGQLLQEWARVGAPKEPPST